jgi:type VI secretion system secreted protein VgrG
MALEHHLQVSFECQDYLSMRRFTVHEELSDLFQIEIIANSPNDDLDLEKFTGKLK